MYVGQTNGSKEIRLKWRKDEMPKPSKPQALEFRLYVDGLYGGVVIHILNPLSGLSK